MQKKLIILLGLILCFGLITYNLLQGKNPFYGFNEQMREDSGIENKMING